MIVPSLPFLLFAALGALLFNLGRGAAWRQAVLLALNLAFLASFSHDPIALAPFAAFLGFGYAAYRLTRGGARPHRFMALAVLIIAAFFWLKHYTFIPAPLFLGFPYLVVGLSYVFFRVLALVIDGHQQAETAPVGLLSYLNYTLNFTSLVSGPIQRYDDYRAQELAPPALTLTAAGQGTERIVRGYFKVAIVSVLLSALQHRALDALAAGGALPERAWQGALVVALYPLYLYCNFSGYVDVVIGTARFYRLVLPENFDRPFSATNFIALWGRWHITLSNWLKSYVFNPLVLAGMRRVKSPARRPYLAVGAFFVTFFLVGVWHGRTSEFLFFGVLQGGGVAANKLYQLQMERQLGRRAYATLCANRAYTMLSRGLTFTWFAFTLLWFWSNWHQIAAIADMLGAPGIICAGLLAMAAATIVLAAMEASRAALLRLTWHIDPGDAEPVLWSRYCRTVYVTVFAVVTAAATWLLALPAPDIVYKAF